MSGAESNASERLPYRYVESKCKFLEREVVIRSRLELPRLLRVMFVIHRPMRVVVAVVVQSDAVELLERIRDFAHGSRKARVQWHTLNLRGSNVDTLTLLDVPEVRSFDAVALVRNDWRFRVTQQRPLRSAEEGSGLDVRRTSSRSESSGLILDQKLADKRLAEAAYR